MKCGIRGVIWTPVQHFEDARKQIRKITADYINCNILPIVHKEGRMHCSLLFENGDYWQIRITKESSRACYSNISYIDYRTDKEFINRVIKYATRLLPYNAIHYY